ncbi:MAG: hypothetical protein SCK28_05920 [Bacillota bacterium]|nr:hypothetical protein [Bacillota bacterium]
MKDKWHAKSQYYYQHRMYEEAVNRERVYFTKTSKTVNPRQEDPFLYIKGEAPILVLAPYAVRYRQKKKTQVSHEYTGGTVLMLNELLGCSALTVSKLYGGDPLNDFPCIYRDRIVAISKEQKLQAAIVLIAAGRESDFLLEIQHPQTNTEAQEKFMKKIYNQTMEFQQLVSFSQITEDKENRWLPGFITNQLHVPSLAIKINRKARVPHQNGQAYCSMLALLVQLLQ